MSRIASAHRSSRTSSVAGRGRVALVEDEVEHREHRAGAGRGSSASLGTRYGMPASLILRLARTSRCAMVVSGTRKARAISGVDRPPSSRSVSATWAAGASAGWQQVKISRSRSSRHRTHLLRLRPGSRCSARLGVLVMAGCLPSQPVDRPVAGGRGDPARRVGRQAGGRPPLGRDVNASWTASSARSMSPRRRTRVARTAVLLPVDAGRSGRVAGARHQAVTPRARPGTAAPRPAPAQATVALRPQARPASRSFGLDHPEAAELLLGLPVRAVGGDTFARRRRDHGGGRPGRSGRRANTQAPAAWISWFRASTSA